MLVTLSGIVMLMSTVQFRNAEKPILVTLSSVGIMLVLHPTTRDLLAVSIMQFPLL